MISKTSGHIDKWFIIFVATLTKKLEITPDFYKQFISAVGYLEDYTGKLNEFLLETGKSQKTRIKF